MENRISNKDIMESDLSGLFHSGAVADCMYTDPPWGIGALKMFRTMNGQAGMPVDWKMFLECLKGIRDRHVKGPSFIETGCRFEGDLVSVFGRPDKIIQAEYGSKKTENIVLCYGAAPELGPKKRHGLDLVLSVLGSLSPKPRIVLDPCIGLGMTAKACKALEIACFGNELGTRRMERTMEILPFVKV